MCRPTTHNYFTHKSKYISYAAFKVIRHIQFGDVAISCCWFHFAQAVVKRVNKTGLKDDSINDAHVRDSVHCLVALPLLPPQAIPDVVVDIQGELDSDSTHSSNLRKLIAYVQRHWVTKRIASAQHG